MLAALVFLLIQAPTERAVLVAEDARSEDVSPILAGLASRDPRLQLRSARALGRLERPELAQALTPLLGSPSPEVRKEAVNALGQMGAATPLGPLLETETSAAVRGVIYRTMGRLPHGEEALLSVGLRGGSLEEVTGALQGLEALVRLRQGPLDPTTVNQLRTLGSDARSALLRRLALTILARAGDRHPPTLRAALQDSDPQVRLLAVRALKVFKDDPSYLVRIESLRAVKDCGRSGAALKDLSPHVAVVAIDLLAQGCDSEPLERLLDGQGSWLLRSRALVSLSKSAPEKARERLGEFAEHTAFQTRVYAAQASRILEMRSVLERLLRDPHPNVRAAALGRRAEAVEALKSEDYGLIMKAVEVLDGWPQGSTALLPVLEALERIGSKREATSRDPRSRLLGLLGDFGNGSVWPRLEPLLKDFDPVIARMAAQLLTEKTGRRVEAATRRLETRPLPDAGYLAGLDGARARVRMREAGSFTLSLLTDQAPVTVARFTQLSESGYYDGLTFHRIVPNFVIQGGSPGANEYVGTADYIRDEVGLISHLRGTLGISTRGRDTGDSQIFINLVDNYRLDHNYTVFARVAEGMEVVDRITEFDVIEKIQVLRKGER